MNSFAYKFIFLLVLALLADRCLTAQNLVPNPDFEFYAACPMGVGGLNYMLCEPWHTGGTGTSDYFNSCSNPSDVGVPINDFGFQNAHSGEGYAGFFTRHFTTWDYREYIQVSLLSPLIADRGYYVSFWVSLPEQYCAIETIGAYLSIGPPVYQFSLPINATPQVESHQGFLNDMDEWMHIEGCFIASGGENVITIGNFHSNDDTPIDPLCNSIHAPRSYYYIDDVTVSETEVDDFQFDLGDDVIACYSYTIDPDINSNQYVEYHWEDGSIGPTLTVTTSGTYSVTINNGCLTGVDSIGVVIIDASTVDLGDDAVTMCPGQSISFSLDPSLGNYIWSDGTISPDYTIFSSGTYSVTLDNGCDPSSDLVVVNVVDPPDPITLGDQAFLCEGNQIELHFEPDLGEFLWQDNSTDNSYIVTEGGIYSVTISNICGEVSASLNVEEEIPIQVDLGADDTYLCNGDNLDLHLDPLLGGYVWQDGSTGPNYHISNPGWYRVTLTQVCSQSEDSIQVHLLSAPSINLGDTLSFCPGDTFTLSVTSISGSYLWQDSTTNDSFLVSSPGTYSLTIENSCGVDSDDVVLINPPALLPPDLGSDFSLCPGQQFILSAGDQIADYVWQDLSTADTLSIDTAGIYSVRVLNACYSYSDTIIVTVDNNPPIIVLPDQIVLCQGSVMTLDPGVTNVNYLWNDGTQNPTLAINSPGDYSLTVTSACGSDVDTVHVMDGGTVPFVTLGPDVSICPGQTLQLIPFNTDVDSWMWPDGSASPVYTVSDSGLIDVVVSNGCGLAYDTIHVGLLDAIPNLDLGVDTSFCNGQSIALSILIPNVDILWSDGSSASSLIVNQPGSYFATISNVCGNSSDTLNLGLLPDVPVLDLGADRPLCPGEMITLSPGISDVNYQWQDGSSDSIFLADHDQTIALTISNVCGNSTDSLQIFISTDGPDVDLGQDVRACEGEVVTINSNISGVDYLWQDGSTGPSINTSTSGTFYVEVTNSCGADSDTITVDVHGTAPVVDLGPDSTLCEGNSITLTSSPDVETLTTWQDGSTSQNYVVTVPGTYTLVASNQCGSDSDTAIISFQSLPATFDLGPDQTLCPDDTLILNAPATTDDILWSDGSLLNTLKISDPGSYGLIVSNQCGTTSDQIEITYDDRPIVFPIEDFFEACPGDAILLDVTQLFSASYSWSTGAASSSISVTTPGEYSVTVKTGCQEDTHVIHVIPSEDCKSVNEFFIPNVFSPNGDDVNDLFVISWSEGLDVISMEGSIFDRWGDLMFSSHEIPFSWDGNFGDKKVMPGVYVYKLKVEYLLNGISTSEMFVGDVTVIR